MKKQKFSRLKIIILGGIFIFAVLLPAISKLVTDWFWFQGIGYETIFITAIKARIIVGTVSALLIATFIYINVAIFKKLSKNEPIRISLNKGDHIQLVDISKIINRAAFPVALILGILGGVAISSSWESIYLFINKVTFGALDPILGKDVSYYVFSLPFFKLVFGAMLMIIFISFISSLILYIATGALIIKNRNNLEGGTLKGNLVSIRGEAQTHLSILIALWFGLNALSTYFISMPEVLFSGRGPFVGASYTDIHAILPFLYVFIAASVIAFLLSLINARRNGIRLIVYAFLLYGGVSILGGVVYPFALQTLIVKPNELVKETPYIENHINATQEAWGLKNLEKRDLTGDEGLGISDIRENDGTIKNIRLWDRGPLLDTFGQIQEIRTYYSFISVDNDRYKLGDDYRQVLLSPRELDWDSLPQKNFINDRLTFTHGMGVTLSPVNEKTEEGLPVLFSKDLPPVSSFPDIEITRPEVYYGELSSDYVVVNTKAKEFNFPSGEENVYSTYKGSGGVKVNSLVRKLLYAVRFNSFKIFLSNDITSESRIMYERDIVSRANKALPFIEFDSDPYMIIVEGSLHWIFDGYTSSSLYPYSERVRGGKNYMRNSVKLVIDAYNGSMNAYISDPNDPIILAYSKIYPGVFKPLLEMPENLIAHIRYPEDIFTYQSVLYSTYHMESPQIFYNKEDQWEVPVISGGSSGESDGPILRHLIMKLPGEEKEEFILMLPYTPRGKNNMSAWLAARSDGEHYGELVVYRFPKQSLVFGPKQIVDRINQNADISQQISLWDQRGSQVIQGNLFVIPINESILYVRPLYIRAEGGRIPELKRVIVAYENQIAMEETLDKALMGIFGGTISGGSSKSATDTAKDKIEKTNKELIQEANNYFEKAQSALRAGNWAKYGEEMRKLGNALKKIE